MRAFPALSSSVNSILYSPVSSNGGNLNVRVSRALSLLTILAISLVDVFNFIEQRLKLTPLPLLSVTFTTISDKVVNTTLLSAGIIDVMDGTFVSYKKLKLCSLIPPDLSTALTFIV